MSAAVHQGSNLNIEALLASGRWKNSTPEIINEVACDMFAEELAEAWPGAVVRWGSGQAWVEFNGRHYDAETPDGVEDWRDLPHFKEFPDDIAPTVAALYQEGKGT